MQQLYLPWNNRNNTEFTERKTSSMPTTNERPTDDQTLSARHSQSKTPFYLKCVWKWLSCWCFVQQIIPHLAFRFFFPRSGAMWTQPAPGITSCRTLHYKTILHNFQSQSQDEIIIVRNLSAPQIHTHTQRQSEPMMNRKKIACVLCWKL